MLLNKEMGLTLAGVAAYFTGKTTSFIDSLTSLTLYLFGGMSLPLDILTDATNVVSGVYTALMVGIGMYVGHVYTKETPNNA